MTDQERNDRRWELAAKVLTGTLSAEEKQEWDVCLSEPAFRAQFDQLSKDWSTLGTLPYDRIAVGEDWKNVQQTIRARERQSWMTAVWRYAAVAVIGLSVAFYLGQRLGRQGYGTPQLTTIEAPPGSRTAITLPDSSRVWLNAHSRISFSAGFGAAHRDVVMEGEAFFDVAHSDVPFAVRTPQYTIEVLGTAFNVSAYADEAVSSTTLVRGSLKVTRAGVAGREEAVVLKPNEKAIIRQGAALVVEKHIDAAPETAWKEGWLTVRGESLQELARKIERLYDVRVTFEDKALEGYRYSGRIRQFSLEQVLKALALTSPVEFTIREKQVVLRENKSDRSKYKSLQTPVK